MADRVPQLTDDVIVEFRFRPETEDWADDLLRESWVNTEVRRTRDTDALVVETRVGGNTNGLDVLAMVATEFAEALKEGDVDPMEFTVTVRTAVPRGA